jgi:branched-chain amino acid transport system permease protein
VGGISGRSSVIAGGLVIGLLEQSVAAYIGSGWQDLAVFAALIIVLVLRPSGLFASRSAG